MRSKNPLVTGWRLIMDHQLIVWLLLADLVFLAISPLAALGWALLIILGGLLWTLGCRLVVEWRKSRVLTHMELPGGLLTLRGTVTLDQMHDIRAQWNRSNVEPLVLPHGVKWLRVGPPSPHASPVAEWPETDGIHPPLPEGIRDPAWTVALAVEQDRIAAEAVEYSRLKTDYKYEVLDDAGGDDHQRMIKRARGISGYREKNLTRIANGLEKISPEGARLGELLWRGEGAGPELPRTWVPILDRSFTLLTDCRYHHMAEHGIEALRDGLIVRRCDVCSPSTFWIEAA